LTKNKAKGIRKTTNRQSSRLPHWRLASGENLSHHRTYGSRIRRFVRHQHFALYTKIPSVFAYDKARLGKPESFLIELQTSAVYDSSFLLGTMASADFSSVIQPMRPPQVRTCSFLQSLLNLLTKLNPFQAFGRHKKN